MRPDRLTTLVRDLRALAPACYGPQNVGRMMRDLRATQNDVAPFVTRRPGGYTRNLVYANEHFEVMVLVWDRGARTAIHDHGDQQCWLTAVSGSFDLENYRRISGGTAPGPARIKLYESCHRLSIGEDDYRHGDEDIHRVMVSDGCDEAISVHVYTHPLAACLVYDEQRDMCSKKVLSYDTVAPDRLVVNF